MVRGPFDEILARHTLHEIRILRARIKVIREKSTTFIQNKLASWDRSAYIYAGQIDLKNI